MEFLKSFFDNIIYARILKSVIVFLLSLIIYKWTMYILNKGEEKSKLKVFSSNKGKTYVKLIRSIVRYFFMTITILIILQINGINVNSVLAGVGILGAVFGLAIQDWLKDVIRGSSIISDNYFSVGDIVKYKDIEGKVLVVGLKTTKIQDLATSNVISIANRNIEEVQVVSKFIYVRVPMPYDVSVERAEKVIGDIVELVKQNNNVNNCKYKGVTELSDSFIEYLLEVDCNQQFKLQVRRDTLRSILLGLEKNNIEVPYTQIDIHNK